MCARPPIPRRPRPTGGHALAVSTGARSAAGLVDLVLPRWSALGSTADSLSVLPTLTRRDDDACNLPEVTRLADEFRDRERGGRPVVADERHGAVSCVGVELEGAVRQPGRPLGSEHERHLLWHAADCYRRQPSSRMAITRTITMAMIEIVQPAAPIALFR